MEANEEELAHPEEQAEETDANNASTAGVDKAESAEDKVAMQITPIVASLSHTLFGPGFGTAQKETRCPRRNSKRL